MTSLAVFLMILSSSLAGMGGLKLRGAAAPACGCQCSSLVWQDKYGDVQGNCRSADHTQAKWCYVKEGSTCSDLVPSARHPRNPWSYQACATPSQGQCATGEGMRLHLGLDLTIQDSLDLRIVGHLMQTLVVMVKGRHLVSVVDHTLLNRDSFLQPL